MLTDEGRDNQAWVRSGLSAIGHKQLLVKYIENYMKQDKDNYYNIKCHKLRVQQNSAGHICIYSKKVLLS